MSRSETGGGSRLGAGGSVAVEAAASLLMLAALGGAAIDLARYYALSIRTERVAYSTADLVTRAESVRDRAAFDGASRTNDLGMFFEMARLMAEPERLYDAGGVVIASITPGPAGRTVNWIRAAGPGGDASAARFGSGPALPAGMPFIVVEVSLPFDPAVLDSPALLGAIGFEPVIRRQAVLRPRSAALTTLEPPG